VERRLERATELFDNHDPYPFRERRLDQAAEAYIVSHTENLPAGRRIHIVLHLPQQEVVSQAAAHLEEAITRHFSERAEATQRSLSQLSSNGRRALAIGLAVLALSVLVVWLAENVPGAHFPKLFVEGPATQYLSPALQSGGRGESWRLNHSRIGHQS
jgi:hypothetical protein